MCLNMRDPKPFFKSKPPPSLPTSSLHASTSASQRALRVETPLSILSPGLEDAQMLYLPQRCTGVATYGGFHSLCYGPTFVPRPAWDSYSPDSIWYVYPAHAGPGDLISNCQKLRREIIFGRIGPYESPAGYQTCMMTGNALRLAGESLCSVILPILSS